MISICIPIYGVEKYIERCAKSLFEQTYKDVEYVFVDDCSPDGSITILNKLIDNYPEKKRQIKIIRHDKNRGLAAARNTAIQKSTGEFVMHVDSDDYIEINTIEECVKKQREGDYDIVSFDIIQHKPHRDRKIIQPDFSDNEDLTMKMLNGKAFHGVVGHLIKRSLYVENGILALEGVNMAEDYFVIPQLAYNASRVANLHKCFYHYDCTNVASYTKSFSIKSAEQQILVNQRLQTILGAKEMKYERVLKERYIQTLLNHLKYSALAKDIFFYNSTLKRLDLCEKNVLYGVKSFYIIPYFIRNLSFVHLFFKLTKSVYKLLNQLKFWKKYGRK